MSKLLTIGQVARRLRKSVDYVRRLDDEGVLKSEPHRKGEHRRYREEVVTAHQVRQNAQRVRQRPRTIPKPARRPPAARPRIPLGPDPDPFLGEDEGDLPEEFMEPSPDTAPAPRLPTLPELLHLQTLRSSGRSDAPWGLPTEWRAKLEAEIEQYVTLEQFPLNGDFFVARLQISKRVREFLKPYEQEQAAETERQRQEQAAEAERQRKHDQVARAAEQRRQELIDYGRKLAYHETASWASDDPTAEARRDVELVLQAEVKADWKESDVRKLVEERLDQYEEEEDGAEENDAEEDIEAADEEDDGIDDDNRGEDEAED